MNIYNDKNLKPMLLHEIDKPFNDKNYIFELKFDGIRALIITDSNKIIIKNRNGNILNNIYPELINIKNIVKRKTIFDGEIVILNSDGIPSFEKLQERNRLKNKDTINFLSKNSPVTFVCFDILYDNKDLTSLPLIKRKKYLKIYKDTKYFVKTKYINEKGIDLFKIVKKMNLEGIVAKQKNSKYLINERSYNWIKIKNIKDDDFLICGYYEKNPSNVASLIIGELRNNKLYFVSKVII